MGFISVNSGGGVVWCAGTGVCVCVSVCAGACAVCDLCASASPSFGVQGANLFRERMLKR
jgi:hypothetical protein